MTAAHPLDRPVWNALSGRQSDAALGSALALRFAPDIGAFAAARDDDPESLHALADLVPLDGGLILLQAGDTRLPSGTVAAKQASGVQLVAERLAQDRPRDGIVPLGDGDVAEMLALVARTEPGPFRERTHRLGDFVGVRVNGRLVAMAGERMKPQGFTEVSGVCTHPDFRGRGYAATLSHAVAARILARGETPFLHAFTSNTVAIALYEALGFVVRRPVTMTMLARA